MLVAGPARDEFVSLNPLDEPPPVWPPLTYREQARLIEGEYRTEVGLPAELWRQDRSGQLNLDGQVVANRTVTDWLVEPGTGVVLERRVIRSIDTIGTATVVLTMAESGGIAIHADEFKPGPGYIPHDSLFGKPAGSNDRAPNQDPSVLEPSSASTNPSGATSTSDPSGPG